MKNQALIERAIDCSSNNKDYVKFFHENGFLFIPDVLSSAEVVECRNYLKPIFEKPAEERMRGDTSQYLFDAFCRYKPLQKMLVNPKVVEVLTNIFGERPALVREAAAQFRNYSGWHKDSTGLERGGQTFHHDKECLFISGLFYLQENDPVTGGGLDVEPGSHRKPDRYVNAKPKAQPKPTFWDRLLGRKIEVRQDYGYDVADIENVYSIPSTAGSLVIFDFRLDHRATPNTSHTDPEKMAITQLFARSDKYLEAYHNFLGHRADYYYLKNFSYPADFAEDLERAGISAV
jgi:ectoine hydroxylase-related dioxygenase (phytanoyl-CoA dioxygenase family)